jgi:1-acyl-sn-glycerol-3-phosphate acyltransferase
MVVSIWLALCALFLFLLFDFILKAGSTFARIAGRSFPTDSSDRIIRIMFSLLRRLAGFRFQYEKTRPKLFPPRFLVVANHQSLLDIPVVMDFFRFLP